MSDIVEINLTVPPPQNTVVEVYIPTGPQGSTAYEVAVENGFSGTEEEWQAALVGAAATITLGTVTTGAAGSSASVTNTGLPGAAIFNFTIPRGDIGDSGTLTIGTVTTGIAGSSAIITNIGTSTAAILDIAIPRGATGPQGDTAYQSYVATTSDDPALSEAAWIAAMVPPAIDPDAVSAALGLGSAAYTAAADYSAAGHNHAGVYDPAGTATAAVSGHSAAADPHGDRAYADSLVMGLVDDRGSFDASINTFPTAGGSGTAGAILKGDLWTISVVAASGPLVGYQVGCLIRALADTPGQTAGNWSVLAVGFGYSPENAANKSTSVTADQSSDIKYPTVKALYDWAVGAFSAIGHNHTGVYATAAQGSLADTSVQLAGAQTIAGAKTLTGQLALTGQSAVDVDSAMTRGLGDARYAVLPYVGAIDNIVQANQAQTGLGDAWRLVPGGLLKNVAGASYFDAAKAYVAPVAGLYQASGMVTFATVADNTALVVGVFKNGGLFGLLGRGTVASASTSTAGFSGCIMVPMAAGDTLALAYYAFTPNPVLLTSVGGYIHYSVRRIT